MTVETFIDSTVLIYAVDTSPEEASKRDIARAVIRADNFGTSAQVVQEFYRVTTVKLRRPLPPTIAARWVDRLLRMPFVATDAILVKTAIIRSHAYQISYLDGATLSAAEALGATRLLTEDLNNGQTYGSVTAINPFV